MFMREDLILLMQSVMTKMGFRKVQVKRKLTAPERFLAQTTVDLGRLSVWSAGSQ